MTTQFDSIVDQLSASWKTHHAPRSKRAFRCDCGRPVFFGNSECLGCGAPLGYEPWLGEVRALHPGETLSTWRPSGDSSTQRDYRHCANFYTVAGCNWLVQPDDASPLCIACRLNRTLPDLNDADNQRYWRAIEGAKRRLVAQLL